MPLEKLLILVINDNMHTQYQLKMLIVKMSYLEISLRKVVPWVRAVNLTLMFKNIVQTYRILKWAILDKVKLALIMEWIWEQFTTSWKNILPVRKWYVLKFMMPEFGSISQLEENLLSVGMRKYINEAMNAIISTAAVLV